MSKTLIVKPEKICKCGKPTLPPPPPYSLNKICYCANCGNVLTIHHKLV